MKKLKQYSLLLLAALTVLYACNGEDEEADAEGYLGRGRQVGMAGGKGHLEINERIVGDVERIRDVAEETADSLATPTV